MPLCDGKGRQVTFGIAEEFLHASIKYGPGRVPSQWLPGDANQVAEVDELYPEAEMGRRYMTIFSPPAFALGLDEVMEQCGADMGLDMLACLPVLDGNRIVGVEVENKSGRIAIGVGCVIDAVRTGQIAKGSTVVFVHTGGTPEVFAYNSELWEHLGGR